MSSGKKNQILLGPSTFGEVNSESLSMLQEKGYEVVSNPFKRKLTKKELLELLTPQVVGLVAGLETLDKEVMSQSSLKVISRCGSGMSNVDQGAAKELGIKVYSTPDGPTNAVAELVLGALLSLLRGLPQASQALHQRKWEKKIGGELRGKTLAIIGFGRIGVRVAALAHAFGAKVIAVDPFVKKGPSNVVLMSLEDALPQADIITLHSSSPERVLGPHEFSLMKQSSILLNAARGELVDEQALADSIVKGRIAGAWIDTFQKEPYDGPLCDLANVLLTPHIGSYTAECRLSMEMESVVNLLNGLES